MIKDLHFQFTGFFGSEGYCHLRIAQKSINSKIIIICSQYKNYYGTSATNAIEIIAEKFFYDVVNGKIKGISLPNIFDYEEWHDDVNWIDQMLVKLDPDKYKYRFKSIKLNISQHFNDIIWIERYPAGTGLNDYEDDFRLVSMGDQEDPHWHEKPSNDFIRNETGFELSDLLADKNILDLDKIKNKIKNIEEAKSLISNIPNRQIRWTHELLKQLPSQIKNMKFNIGDNENITLNEVTIQSLIIKIFSVLFPDRELFTSEYKISKLLNIHQFGSEKKCDFVIFEPETLDPYIFIEVKRATPLIKNQTSKIIQDIAKLLICSKKFHADSYLLICGEENHLKEQIFNLEHILSFKNRYEDANNIDKKNSVEFLELTKEYKELLEKFEIFSVNTRLIGISNDNTVALWQISHTPSNLVSNKPYQYRIFRPLI
ncbi:hypothetical protein ABTH02_09455 [Acinetobacter baumannii]